MLSLRARTEHRQRSTKQNLHTISHFLHSTLPGWPLCCKWKWSEASRGQDCKERGSSLMGDPKWFRIRGFQDAMHMLILSSNQYTFIRTRSAVLGIFALISWTPKLLRFPCFALPLSMGQRQKNWYIGIHLPFRIYVYSPLLILKGSNFTTGCWS